jgi:hypothetical protein
MTHTPEAIEEARLASIAHWRDSLLCRPGVEQGQ